MYFTVDGDNHALSRVGNCMEDSVHMMCARVAKGVPMMVEMSEWCYLKGVQAIRITRGVPSCGMYKN